MKVCHTLICVFLLSLQDGNTGFVNAQITVYAGTEGGNVTVQCTSTFSPSRKFFCREPCGQKDYVIVTTDDRAQRGRYSIERRRRDGYFLLNITQLTKSNSGLYRCGSVTSFSSNFNQIEIIVVDAQLSGDPSDRSTLYKRSGGEITVQCVFSSSETRKYFCREPCGEKDFLVETTGDRVKRGRYSIEFVPGSPSGGFLFVSISQLNKADSGRYRCALDRPLSPDPHRKFELVVSDVPTSTSVPSASSPPPTHSLCPTPSSASPETTQQSAITTPDMLLYVGVTLAVMVVLLSLTLLIFCRRKSSKLQEPPEETEYAYVTETNRVYEDIREDRQSRSPPVEMSSVYTSAKYTKPSRADANDDHSFVSTQNTAEDDSSKLIYSELNFSNRAGLGSGDLHGGDDNVIYSVPRVKDDPPVFSTVT